jgi:hypothetical protein
MASKMDVMIIDDDDSATENDEDGQEPLEIDLPDSDDIFPLTPTQVENVKRKIIETSCILPQRKIERRVSDIYYEFDDLPGEKRK